MRRQFEMTEKQLETLLDACKPTPVMYLSGGMPMHNSPQQNANDAWNKLGEEMGFEGATVEPAGRGDRYFTAEEKAK